ncbi:LL-diaminopimelate aminotransferase [candidate division TA06 bacterium B3_TA06]|uniref:Aminotransferase n=1 Tax=candidate division TA06 bacterium B3_TA06 TaxID=2012487 RepID=A0A532V649_UNCT6|nr:MAG: LL-diaminopimelate aminotransferase [candidate division TA06 bacterium B3_TA06]
MREHAKRLDLLPPYLFAELDAAKATYGEGVIDFGVGDPDQPTHPEIVNALSHAANDPSTHRYPSYEGTLSLRRDIAYWYKDRFGVDLDPQTEVCVLIGSKEGIGHLIWALVDPGDEVIYPDPSYPVCRNQTLLAGGTPIPAHLLEANHFIMDIPRLKATHKTKLLILNYPSNPTAAVASPIHLAEAVQFARAHNMWLANDNTYSEIYFDEEPTSILAVPGAKECAVEFGSFSKTFNMTGWRIGFAVGNARMIAALLKIKRNTDSGVFVAIQRAAQTALELAGEVGKEIRALYKSRRGALFAGLNQLGWVIPSTKATFYVWAQVPHKDSSSLEFARKMLAETGVLVTPGIGFGEAGEGYVRFSLTLDRAQIQEAVDRLGKWL